MSNEKVEAGTGAEEKPKANEENVKVLTKRVKKIISEARIVFDQMDEAKEWDTMGEVLRNINLLYEFAKNVIMAVEIAATELSRSFGQFTSADKLEAAAQMLDDWIRLPFFMEPFDKHIFRMLLSVIVTQLNEWVGKKWDVQLMWKAIHNNDKYYMAQIDRELG